MTAESMKESALMDQVDPMSPSVQADFDAEKRDVWAACMSGLQHKCPNCATGPLYRSYLKVHDHCPHCSEALYHHRADDAPPYFTIFIVGHLIIPAMIAVEMAYAPALWLHGLIWAPAILLLCMGLLPRVKGFIVGLQWGLKMHGFDPSYDETKDYGGNLPT